MKLSKNHPAQAPLPKPQSGPSQDRAIPEEDSRRIGPSDRLSLASGILQNPERVSPPASSLLTQAFASAKGVALDLVSGLLLVDVPEPVPESLAESIGRRELADMKDEYGVNQDPQSAKRLNQAVLLAKKALSPDLEVNEVVVLDTDLEHGCCTPDGSILVSKGLMDVLTDKELLFVVGHEIGHLLREDDAQRLSFEKELTPHRGEDGEIESLRGKLLERKMEQFFHQAEFASDEFGVKAFQENREGREAGVSYFFSRPLGAVTPTHPADSSRISRIATGD